jgi:hypothetical protein
MADYVVPILMFDQASTYQVRYLSHVYIMLVIS